MKIDFQPEFSKYRFHDIPINSNYVLSAYKDRIKVNPKFSPYVVFEFGYCSTCHLAQGSQYDTVLVYVEGTKSRQSLYFRQWLYTAITRAKKKLILVI